MAGLLTASMKAPAADANDMPDRPLYLTPPEDDEWLAEDEGPTAPVKPAAPKPIVPRTPIAPRTPVTPTYRPAFVPPKPAAPAPRAADAPKVDLSRVGPGATVIHRAFGEGTVAAIEKKPTGSAYIRVVFGKNERSFGFPGAFHDGFLKGKEM